MAFAWPLFRAMLNSISKLSLAPLEIANFSSLLIAVKELQELTGYLRGGVTALALRKLIRYTWTIPSNFSIGSQSLQAYAGCRS